MFTPALWSAIAAMCSAAAALLTLQINRQNRLEAARPEIAVAEWKRDSSPDRIYLAAIQNLGRGPALHVAVLGASKRLGNVSKVTIGQSLIPILAVGEPHQFGAELWLEWERTIDRKWPFATIDVDIVCWDLRVYRHVTRYEVAITKQVGSAAVEALEVGQRDLLAIAEVNGGVRVHRRRTLSTPIWRLKFRRRLSRMWFLRRWIRPDDRAHPGRNLHREDVPTARAVSL